MKLTTWSGKTVGVKSPDDVSETELDEMDNNEIELIWMKDEIHDPSPKIPPPSKMEERLRE